MLQWMDQQAQLKKKKKTRLTVWWFATPLTGGLIIFLLVLSHLDPESDLQRKEAKTANVNSFTAVFQHSTEVFFFFDKAPREDGSEDSGSCWVDSGGRVTKHERNWITVTWLETVNVLHSSPAQRGVWLQREGHTGTHRRLQWRPSLLPINHPFQSSECGARDSSCTWTVTCCANCSGTKCKRRLCVHVCSLIDPVEYWHMREFDCCKNVILVSFLCARLF